ncbi:MAG: hypothetical protein K2Q97_15885 [Burkholderiaceae bacterium]|nr:hypothetical protein [Burkholderiaceae bacterium]
MNHSLRACIANIAARLTGHSTNSAVYCYTQGKHISVSGTVTSSAVNIYDYDRGAHVSGSPTNLYDYGGGAHITLEINGNDFKGYDYGSGNHYSGKINGQSVQVYDYETGQHHSFTV